MGRIENFENATSPREKALAALEVSANKSSKNAAWYWAEIAVKCALQIGIDDAESLIGSGRWPNTMALREAILRIIPGSTLGEVLAVAKQGPTGLPDFEAVRKLQDEMVELQEMIALGDDNGAYLEAADVAYYAAKAIDLAARKVGLEPEQLFGLAAKKYHLRFVTNKGRKDDRAEREILLTPGEKREKLRGLWGAIHRDED